MAIDLARFNAMFLAESFSGLDSMETDLLEIERGSSNPELLQAIFRTVHSIKGGSGSLGFDAIADFSHQLESLLDKLRSGQVEPNRELVNLLLRSVDVERSLLGEVQNGIGIDMSVVEQLKNEIAQWHSRGIPIGLPKTEAALGQAVTYSIEFKPHRGFFLSGNDPICILRELASLGEIETNCEISELPPLAEIDPEASYLSWACRLHTVHTSDAVREVFACLSVGARRILTRCAR